MRSTLGDGRPIASVTLIVVASDVVAIICCGRPRPFPASPRQFGSLRSQPGQQCVPRASCYGEQLSIGILFESSLLMSCCTKSLAMTWMPCDVSVCSFCVFTARVTASAGPHWQSFVKPAMLLLACAHRRRSRTRASRCLWQICRAEPPAGGTERSDEEARTCQEVLRGLGRFWIWAWMGGIVRMLLQCLGIWLSVCALRQVFHS